MGEVSGVPDEDVGQRVFGVGGEAKFGFDRCGGDAYGEEQEGEKEEGGFFHFGAPLNEE